MKIVSTLLTLDTQTNIELINVTQQVQQQVDQSGIQQGHAVVFSCHTTTALVVNEYEERLLVDIKAYLKKLAPPNDRYLHNDLHLRVVPPDEPMNAHSHLMAMTLSNSELIPVVDGKLALGTYQAILLVELDGPRQRRFRVQVAGIE
ncbi:MAG: secondary thiamine-phosphate synthase enzyme YjbQ [Cyanobacteria bacterium P01_A01_bin.105]